MSPPSKHPSDPSSLRQRRLAQIHRRDPQAEGRFWYSVLTTRVYCRPTCPARRALPENIRLHDTLADARATGFRPCGRCLPEGPSPQDRRRRQVQAICRMIDRADPPLSSRALAQAVGLSASQLHRLFKQVTGLTPRRYALACRADAVRRPALHPSASPREDVSARRL